MWGAPGGGAGNSAAAKVHTGRSSKCAEGARGRAAGRGGGAPLKCHYPKILLRLETSILALETSIPALETSIPALETSILALEASIPALEASIAALETSIPALENSIPALETSGD